MKKIILLVVCIAVSTVFGQKSTNHNIGCYANLLTPVQLIEEMTYNLLKDQVQASLDEELEFGLSSKAATEEKYKLRQNGSDYNKVNSIMKKLVNQVSKFSNPTSNPNFGKYKDHYEIYMMESEEINAFTAGCKIYFTTAMYKFCQSEDEIAAVIAHEISHNELGHFNERVRKNKLAQNYLGEDYGVIFNYVATVLTLPFNQKHEGHCDLFGIDLAKSAGYSACADVEFWKRAHDKLEGEKTIFNLLMTHPYMEDRAKCSKDHIKTNYNIECE